MKQANYLAYQHAKVTLQSLQKKHCKKYIAKRIELTEKAYLTSHDIKANYLMQIFTQETSIQHTLKHIKRLSK